MPLMPRLPGKGKKIAWAILGKPAPLRRKGRSKRDKRILLESSY